MLCSNPSDLRRRSRVVRASMPALALVLVATGCVRAKPPGLKVASLESSIVFGLKPLPVAAPPGTPQPELPPSESTDAAPELPPLVPKIPPVLKAPRLPATPPVYLCRTATTTDFPTVATQNAPDPPKEGVYIFKKAPPQLFGADHYDIKAGDLQPRRIMNVTPATKSSHPINSQPAPVGGGNPVTTTYQYDQVTTLSETSYLVDRIKVTDNPIMQSAGSNIGPTTYTGQPDRGVALLNRQLVQKGATASFTPSSPLLLLPLPAIIGESWESVAVDPSSGATYILYGRIKDRQHVDACGNVVEGWAVEAQTVFRDPRASGPQNANFRYYVDTRNGGQVIYEKVDPIGAPDNPANGTPADQAVPPKPTPPTNPGAAPASEWSLFNRDPRPAP